jgi:hypothetical protein
MLGEPNYTNKYIILNMLSLKNCKNRANDFMQFLTIIHQDST